MKVTKGSYYSHQLTNAFNKVYEILFDTSEGRASQTYEKSYKELMLWDDRYHSKKGIKCLIGVATTIEKDLSQKPFNIPTWYQLIPKDKKHNLFKSLKYAKRYDFVNSSRYDLWSFPDVIVNNIREVRDFISDIEDEEMPISEICTFDELIQYLNAFDEENCTDLFVRFKSLTCMLKDNTKYKDVLDFDKTITAVKQWIDQVD